MNGAFGKSIATLIVGSLLCGCSSYNYIATDSYRTTLIDKCMSKLTSGGPNLENERRTCASSAYGNLNLAARLYETRAETDYNQCKQQHADKQGADKCFSDAQDAYYKKWLEAKTGEIRFK